MSNATDLKKQLLKDPEFKAAYERMANEFELASAVIEARAAAGLTQEALADRMDAKQSLVARIESGDQNITVKTLLRVAEATGTHLKITFEH
jgi:ribosome-binding protein aMBF1 (putative translation factor)